MTTGVILAGGQSSRMGIEKPFLRVAGERLIDRQVRLFRSVFGQVIIVAAAPLDYLELDATIVTDIFPGKGALGGIYSGLFHASDERAFVAACDMPYLDRPFLLHMVRLAADYDIVVPAPPDGLQPLHAVYARRCLPAIRGLLERNRLQIRGFYPGFRLLEIPARVIAEFDPAGRMFLNINTPEDLRNL